MGARLARFEPVKDSRISSAGPLEQKQGARGLNTQQSLVGDLGGHPIENESVTAASPHLQVPSKYTGIKGVDEKKPTQKTIHLHPRTGPCCPAHIGQRACHTILRTTGLP